MRPSRRPTYYRRTKSRDRSDSPLESRGHFAHRAGRHYPRSKQCWDGVRGCAPVRLRLGSSSIRSNSTLASSYGAKYARVQVEARLHDQPVNDRNLVRREGPFRPGDQVAVQALSSLFASFLDGELCKTCHESSQDRAKGLAWDPKSDRFVPSRTHHPSLIRGCSCRMAIASMGCSLNCRRDYRDDHDHRMAGHQRRPAP